VTGLCSVQASTVRVMALLPDQMRLIVLIAVCGLLWSLESVVPLYRYQNSSVRHALPNIALTLILILTNLALSFSSAYWLRSLFSTRLACSFSSVSRRGRCWFWEFWRWTFSPMWRMSCSINPGWGGSSIASITPKLQLM